MKRLAMLALAAVLMSCGGDATPPEPQALYDQLREANVCFGYALDADNEELFVRERGTCQTSDRDELGIYTFSGNGQKQWLDFVNEMGGGPMVVGDAWVIATETTAQARLVHDAMGGDLR